MKTAPNPARFIRPLFLVIALLGSPGFVLAQTNWTEQRSGIENATYGTAIEFGNNRFVGIFNLQAGGDTVATSVDGTTWTTVTLPSANSNRGVKFVQGRFYLTSVRTILRSTDTTSWETIAELPVGTYLRSPASDGVGLMAINQSVGINSLWASNDLFTWRETSKLPGTETAGTNVSIGWLTASANRYYVRYNTAPSGSSVFTNRVASTADHGVTWRVETTLATSSYSIATGNAIVLAESGSTILRSEDGQIFTPVTGIVQPGGGLAFAGARFFQMATMRASVAGLSWSLLGLTNGLSSNPALDIAYGNDRYVALGYRSTGLSGTAQSEDIVRILIASTPPRFGSMPRNQTVIEGKTVSLAVSLENASTNTSFQWRRDGSPITGATSSSLVLTDVAVSDAALYDCVVTNDQGTVRTDPATLTVLPFSRSGRIVNVSVLTPLDDGEKMTLGFVLAGDSHSASAFLARAGGPSLASFGVSGAHPNPRLRMYRGTDLIAQNDDWAGASDLTNISNVVGAFPFSSTTSRDAAAYSLLSFGSHTVEVEGAAGTSGTVIAEIYDALPQEAITATMPRLINVSVLKRVGPGRTLTAGFVIRGETPQTVVVRAVGPTLGNYGVPSPQPDPRVELYRGGVASPISSNDNWGGGETLQAAMTAVAAFALPADSKDAVITATLAPGEYTAVVNASGSADGAALVEVYQLP